VTRHDVGYLCRVAVFVDESAEDVGSFDVAKWRDLRWWLTRHRRLEVDASVRPRDVVVAEVLGEDPLEVATTPDQGPVQALGPDRSDPSFGVGVGRRSQLHRMRTFGTNVFG
jgi:hypothetical protein